MDNTKTSAEDLLNEAALHYHEFPKPGKLETRPTKPLANPRDLSLAYSPGVANACLAIKENPDDAVRYTARGNLVAVVTNGSAALGLGNIGALASKPIMEGKAVLFKKFANIDCFDIEIDESDPIKLAEHIVALEPTFGAINLEDIKAPECFIVEKYCREKMNIPVFHDDQHGTAIVVGAAAKNALLLTKRNFADIKVVSTGGGAAGIACLNMLVKLGVRRENIWLCDIAGLVYEGREHEMTPQKAQFAQKSEPLELADVIEGADFFLGLSGPRVLKPEMITKMAKQPIIFALANPTPEIMPELVHEVAPDAIVATGRSDYPNQVNNVLCFPFIFRGALDVGASEINDAMEVACVDGIAQLARMTSSAEAAAVYGDEDLRFGTDYLIPKPFDPRLLAVVASAVARSACETGVAKKPIEDISAYSDKLNGSVYRTAMIMRPIFVAARSQVRKIVFAEGEDERVLRAAVAIIEDSVDSPILIGRPDVIGQRCLKYGLPKAATDRFEIVNPEQDSRYRNYWQTYHQLMLRNGITPDLAQSILRNNTTVIGAIMVHLGDADSLICGTSGQFQWHLKYVEQILNTTTMHPVGALSLMILESGPLFVADTQVHPSPSYEEIAQTVIASARHVKRFGIEPKIALCSSSQFGDLDSRTAKTMRAAMAHLENGQHDFVFEGEMQLETALNPLLQQRVFPQSRLDGSANVLIFSSTETAIAVKDSLKIVSGGIEVGPILMGMGNRTHIVTPSISVRGLINISALAGTPVQNYA